MPFSHCRLIIILLSYICPNPNPTWSLSTHSSYNRTLTNTLMEIANFLDLRLSIPINQVLTWDTDNPNNSNSVINLIFLQNYSIEINNHLILPDLWSPLDHTSLTVNIIIDKEVIQDKWQTIIKNSKEENGFINELKNTIDNIDTSNISDRALLEEKVQEYMIILKSLWNKYSKSVRITKHSKAWWNDECNTKLNIYHISKSLLNWKLFKKGVSKRLNNSSLMKKSKKLCPRIRDLET